MAGALRDCFVPSDPLGRLAVLLDHEYSELGRGCRLKGDDVRRVSLLRAAADAVGLESVLAPTHIREKCLRAGS